MKLQERPGMTGTLHPYFLIALAGILAFAPVSFMLQSLKNDIVAIEYPINYFLSQSIHHGENPAWFNTWGMGFPLYSGLTWGIYSTPQMLFCALFDYNIYILHIEFVFFVLMAGWSMFHLLHKYLLKDENISLVLAICYMLSGFTIGSTQWLLYITAAAFVPWLISSLLNLLKNPGWGAAIGFALVYTMMFTSVYTAFNIITTYGTVIFLIVYFLAKRDDEAKKKKSFLFAAFAGVMTLLLCGSCLYYTVELLQHIDRGQGIADKTFFDSNYLPPASLSSMLFPLSSVRMSFPNTEGTMFHIYAGVFVLLLTPAAILQSIKKPNKTALTWLAVALVFLLLSFGSATPLRQAMNILPGFSYFRHAGIFRFYFLLSLVFFLAMALRHKSFTELFRFHDTPFSKTVFFTLVGWALIAVTLFFIFLKSASGLSGRSVLSLVKDSTLPQVLLLSAVVQLAILAAVLITAAAKRFSWIKWILTADLVVNTLLCTPFFSVSSYTPGEVNTLLKSVKGFPVQSVTVGEAAAVAHDEKKGTWFNKNVFNKEVSSQPTYRGPLTLRSFSTVADDSATLSRFHDIPLVTVDEAAGRVTILSQKPGVVTAEVDLTASATVTLWQNYYPGWKAWYNGNEIAIVKSDGLGIQVEAPPGKSVIEFRYERSFAWISALILHIIVIVFGLTRIVAAIRKRL